MSNLNIEKVLSVKHWNDTLFTFQTTRDQSLRFRNGEFIMIGLPLEDGKKVMRAYSIASPNYEENLEFFSIKVPDGKLTSRLQHLKPGDEVMVSKKPTGTLVVDDLKQGRNLYLLATGTGLAPFLSIVQCPETYEKFDKVILCHGVRFVSELCYQEMIMQDLPNHEYLGDIIAEKLLYYPTVTREPYQNQGRLTHALENGQVEETLGLDKLDPKHDRAMICGSPAMLEDLSQMLNDKGFEISQKMGIQGDYVIERAFVE